MAFPLEDVVDVGASTLPPSAYWFTGRNDPTDAAVIWIGSNGLQLGNSVGIAIPGPGDIPVTLDPPVGAVGCHVRFGAEVVYAKSVALPLDLQVNGDMYPYIPGGIDWTLGRVG